MLTHKTRMNDGTNPNVFLSKYSARCEKRFQIPSSSSPWSGRESSGNTSFQTSFSVGVTTLAFANKERVPSSTEKQLTHLFQQSINIEASQLIGGPDQLIRLDRRYNSTDQSNRMTNIFLIPNSPHWSQHCASGYSTSKLPVRVKKNHTCR